MVDDAIVELRVEIPRALRDRLDADAQERRVSRTRVVEWALTDWCRRSEFVGESRPMAGTASTPRREDFQHRMTDGSMMVHEARMRDETDENFKHRGHPRGPCTHPKAARRQWNGKTRCEACGVTIP